MTGDNRILDLSYGYDLDPGPGVMNNSSVASAAANRERPSMNPLLAVAKRVGAFALRLLFWFYLLGFVLSLLSDILWLGSRLGLVPHDIVMAPTALQPPKTAVILHGLLMMVSAGLGWFYVFRRRFKFLWAFMALYAAFWMTVIVAVPLTVGWGSLPSDAEMLERFSRHEPDFNKLARMSAEDSHLEKISFESVMAAPTGPYTRPAATLDKTRWDEYRGLFKKLGLLGLWRKPQGWGVEVLLPAGEQLELTRQVSKGYAYSTQEPSPLVDSLDGISPETRRPVFMKITDNWYLYYAWANY